MITYSFDNVKKGHYTDYLYEQLRNDIRQGRLPAGQKLPSKRNLAEQLGLSVITVENAYEMLVSEGYIYSIPKRGFYVEEISGAISKTEQEELERINKFSKKVFRYDLSSGKMDPYNFPFSIWKKIMRNTFSSDGDSLINRSTSEGLYELRLAISNHLESFRGMIVDPDCVFIGAGTEYLYGILIQLLGRDKRYCLENPGYHKIAKIYEANDVDLCYAGLDEKGIKPNDIVFSGADIVHISPTHHYPTGIIMPVSRRQEILDWAYSDDGRYIIEDDYDSEFRFNGKPVPAMKSFDINGKVIYMNTFSKSLASTIRISYMILPPKLAQKYYEELSFYTCTVSNFEQLTLARFISEGYFEKHINRMRLFYARKRKAIISSIENHDISKHCDVLESDSGLHFILRIHESIDSSLFLRKLEEKEIGLLPLSSFYFDDECSNDKNLFIINYSSLDSDSFSEILTVMNSIIEEVKK